jgi:hypothetical protein
MGEGVRREDYRFGGYLVTRPVERGALMSAELLPGRLLTASACIARFVPDVWSLEWTTVSAEERRRAAAEVGIAPEALAAIIRQVTAGFDQGVFGWPNVIQSSDALVELVRLLPRPGEWVVLGLALHRSHVAAFLEQNAPGQRQGTGGVYHVLAGEPPLPEGGTVLGFEPLGFENGGQPHSWLCNGLEKECFQALGIRPDANGFLGAAEEAERATAHIARDDVGAEPAQWLPWMILDYTSEVARG